MKTIHDEMALATTHPRASAYTRSARAGMLRAYRAQAEDGFTCKRCRNFVSSAVALAGVLNRNHCPYCLWSRHVDLYLPGDRLCACKAPMRPAGLTQKQTRKKYACHRNGELMLIHICTECSGISINRLAADDDPGEVMQVFESSSRLDLSTMSRLAAEEIQLLDMRMRDLVRMQLFGNIQVIQRSG